MDRLSNLGGVYVFGRFIADPVRRTLSAGGQAVRLQGLQFDLLLLLLRHSDRLVTREEIRSTLWPGRIVEEGSLKQCVFGLRQALARGDPETHYVATVTGRGYRLAVPVAFEPEPASPDTSAAALPPPSLPPPKRRPWTFIAGASAVGAAALLAVGLGWTSITRPPPVRRIVGPVIENRTGDTAFDHAPATLARIDLAQSQSLDLVSDGEIRSTLAFMRRPQEATISPAVANEVCRRLDASATVDGAIDRLGSRYLLTAKATDCNTGRTLALERAEFAAKEQAPAAVDRIAAHIRQALGESIVSSARERLGLARGATTSSFEALRAYSEAMELARSGRSAEEEPLLKRAVATDPEFAAAWVALATYDANTGDLAAAAAASAKAYGLRGKVSPREALKIEVMYDDLSVHDPMAAVRVLRSWLAYNSEDFYAWCDLGDELGIAGRDTEGIEPLRRCTSVIGVAEEGEFVNLVDALAHSGQIAEARAVAARAQTQGKLSTIGRGLNGDLAFLEGDRTALLRLADAERGKPGESWVLYDAVSAALAQGRVREARALETRTATAAEDGGWRTSNLAAFTLELAELGFADEGRWRAEALPETEDPARLGLALAVAGDLGRARALLQRRLAESERDPILLYDDAPTIRAVMLARQGRLAPALDQFRAAEMQRPEGYEIGFDFDYQRGLIALQARRPAEAAAAFRDIIDHPGRDPISPELPLAHLGLARALAALGDLRGAHGEYQALFRLWASADQDLPALMAAQSEDRALQTAKGARS